jgi:hypothetical protein
MCVENAFSLGRASPTRHRPEQSTQITFGRIERVVEEQSHDVRASHFEPARAHRVRALFYPLNQALWQAE